jgi:hypothetical protein
MNCNDIEQILDDGNFASLGAAERARAAAHLAACRNCAVEWEVHARMVTTEIPAPPAGPPGSFRAGGPRRPDAPRPTRGKLRLRRPRSRRRDA